MAGPHAFPRAARLKRRRLIRSLFDRTHSDVGSLTEGCIRLLFRVVPRAETGQDAPVQVGFAPGRTRTAVQRNRLRRLMREAYRLDQEALAAPFLQRPDTLTLMVLFRGDPATASRRLPHDLKTAIHRLAAHYTS